MNRAHAPAQALLLAACAWLPACGLNQAGVPPPPDTIAYPASAVLDRNSDWLVVTNSNADLRYNDGTLIALSLSRAAIDRDPNSANFAMWGDCPQVDYPRPRIDPKRFCCWDRLDSNILNCDERGYAGSDAESMDTTLTDDQLGARNVRIGSFAAGMVLERARCPIDFMQDQSNGEVDCDCGSFDPAATDDRLLIGVRGDTSLTWIDVTQSSPDPVEAAKTPPTFTCTAGAESFALCDDNHRIIKANTQLATLMDQATPNPVPLPDEPYALAIDDANGLLFIGHLTGSTARPFSGGFSLFDIAPQGAAPLPAPTFIAPFPSPFPATSLGSVGITAMNVETDNIIGHVVLASSRYVPEVAGLGTTATCPRTMKASAGDSTPDREIAAFPNGTVYSSPLGGAAETRGIQFVDGAAFVLQRNPPSLIRFDEASAAATDMLETCGSPTFLDLHDAGLGPRLYVTCFADGEVDVFDPAVPTLEKTFIVGRGPSGLVFDRNRPVAYVVGFGDNNVSVIDLTPGSRTEYHVVQRLGFPRTAPR